MIESVSAVMAVDGRHYHEGLAAGENTLNSQVARLTIRTISQDDGYSPDGFLESYREFMTTRGSHNDCYAEAYHRQFFANHLLNGTALAESAGAENHDTPSIGGFVSALPLVLAGQLEDAARHMSLTHRSDRLSASLEVYAAAVWATMAGEWPSNLHDSAAEASRVLGWDCGELEAHAQSHGMSDTQIVHDILGPACYISNSLPVVFYLAYRYSSQEYAADPSHAFSAALLANANAGGENCHRGSVLGALFGAAIGRDALPAELLAGLHARTEIADEIQQFCTQVCARNSRM
eukprot:TRINITY_DN9214_c0_g1_i2.p1 TRINITY_DN9214_c0_g1~~TRINITY_DN9214_c0_g1_i2.p1  ORF type:complete len:292 (-),score=43.26 TRINITY_DN9214_c0_g1_i2:20-895(-)